MFYIGEREASTEKYEGRSVVIVYLFVDHVIFANKSPFLSVVCLLACGLSLEVGFVHTSVFVLPFVWAVIILSVEGR